MMQKRKVKPIGKEPLKEETGALIENATNELSSKKNAKLHTPMC